MILAEWFRDTTSEIIEGGAAGPWTKAADEASYITDGLSGAQVREVAVLALQGAILRTTDAEGHVRLEQCDIDGAVDRVATTKDAGCGFHSGQ